MKKPTLARFSTAAITGFILFCLLTSGCAKRNTDDTTLQIGWQTTWATQGQIALVLKNTDIIPKAAINARFNEFQYGAPMAEAAVAGKLDIAFVGDQPAVSMMARSADWQPLARLMDFRVALVVPKSSTMNNIGDLKGKKIGIPFGSSAHRFVLETLQTAGLSPSDVTLVNLDIIEQGEILRAVAAGKDTDYTAFAAWDPHIAQYEKDATARALAEGRALGVVMVRKPFKDAHPTVIEKFLTAYTDAQWYYAQHKDEVDKWFAKYLGERADLDVLAKVAAFEPNTHATSKNQISISLSEDNRRTLQKAAEFGLQSGLIKTKPPIAD